MYKITLDCEGIELIISLDLQKHFKPFKCSVMVLLSITDINISPIFSKSHTKQSTCKIQNIETDVKTSFKQSTQR